MSNLNLIKILIEQINQSSQQGITFAEYMHLVLYHPELGYYCSHLPKIGTQGDYFTSSSLGADFGELLAKQFLEMWEILGQPSPFIIVEMGAGLGLLAQDILNYFEQNNTHFLDSLNYWLIEQSSTLIKAQKNQLTPYLEKGVKLDWKTWEDIADESIIGCVFSNELVDAFPVHRVGLEKGELKEIYVTYTENTFKEILADPSSEELNHYFKFVGVEFPSDAYPEGFQTEVNLSALSWLKTLSQKLKRGYILTIDYGYPAHKYYHPQRYRGTLNCYYQHRHHHDPYINIGYQDLTAHVDFTALERQGQKCGLEKLGFTQQGLFLMSLGLGDRLNDLSSGRYNLIEVMNRRDALHQLIDPTGLGGFGVLVQCKGLSPSEKERSLLGLQY
ncbi:protein of unknown function DUF185 [Gloeothece citriformis PCC 7424]|uniref:Class I SAM-dependent methyltransferase n=1 Tax=Gloeothece citriformis (strain PCC 7424) TaxID=65393 RepID=B7KB90_GLOC7|nr:class I SAM-dependent methyltransferase [Gloeothece citriformis]ACK71446.1 protein of unknown function DUF185 [Gloeothece citriformis PCC 7424]